MATQTMGTMFPRKAVEGLFNTVKGKSSLAKLSGTMPIAFVGNDMFTFSMDSEVAIVGEGGAYSHGGITVAPVTVKPLKVEYGARITEEFLTASEEEQLHLLEAYNEGFAKKLARGLDIIGLHGLNPRTGTAASSVTNYIDQQNTKKVAQTSTRDPEGEIGEAIDKLGDHDVTGLILSKGMASDLGKLTNASGGRLYPELMWGGQPNSVNGIPADVNSTVSVGTAKDAAIVGDFANYLKWGYAQDVSFEIIRFGDPDNSGVDLAGNGQIYLRSKCYIGIAIMDIGAFARVVTQ